MVLHNARKSVDGIFNQIHAEFNALNDRQFEDPQLQPFVEHMKQFESRLYSSAEQNLRAVNLLFGRDFTTFPVHIEKLKPQTSGMNYGALSVFDHLAKDWSHLRCSNWNVVTKKIITDLNQFISLDSIVCIPGCALSRLVYDISSSGFRTMGVEFSLSHIYGCNYIFNVAKSPLELSFYPFLPDFKNNNTVEDRLHQCQAPIFLPDPEITSRICLKHADFVRTPLKYDAVVTSFVIDCFPNIISAMQKIYNELPSNGVWLHFGPLQYHVMQIQSESGCLFPAWEQIEIGAKAIGFEVIKSEIVDFQYDQRPNTMRKELWDLRYAVFRKS